MKIAYLTIGASDDVGAWSGIPFFMSDGFARAGADLIRIQNLRGAQSLHLRCRDLFRRRILHENYSTFRHKKRLVLYARQVAEIANRVRAGCNCVPEHFADGLSRNDIPIVIWTDATFHSLLNFYPEYFNMSDQAIAEGDAAERAALERCTLALYASEWAAQSAIGDHGADPRKVRVIPMGANLQETQNEPEVARMVRSRPADRCELLLLGVDWVRKGCAIAVDVAKELNRRGLPTTLTIAGCNPPDGVVPDCVQTVGFIDKRTHEGTEKLKSLLAKSHFLILPSRAECFGIVFAEANSFGVPVLASRVGGIPSAVSTGKNGFTVPIQSDNPRGEVEKYCDLVTRTMSSPAAYYELAMSSFREYRDKLNWRVATTAALKAMGEKIY